MSDGSGSTSWTYDSRGRMLSETKSITGSGTFVTQWGDYNSAGQPGYMKYPGGNNSEIGEQVNFSYLAQKALDSVIGSSTYVQRTDYDAAGRVDLRKLGSSLINLDYLYYGWAETALVDGVQKGQGGRLKRVTAGTLQDLTYVYDPAGNLRSIADAKVSPTQTQTFTYDALNRLSMAAAGGTLGLDGAYSQETYAYDSQGRLSSLPGMGTYTYSTSHIHAVEKLNGVQKYWYDANGNMTTRVVGANTFTLGYDAENRLTTVSGAATNAYVYDGDGQRVRETSYENLAAGASSTGSATIYYPEAITDGDTYPDGGVNGEYAQSGATGLQSVLLDLGQAYMVDKLKVWHFFVDGRTYHNTKTQVSADGATWYTVFDSAVSGEYAETSAGRTYTFTARSVRYVRDYLNGSTANIYNHWVEIEAYGSRTTAHIGNYYEWTGSTAEQVKYYYAGSTRVAMRVGNGTGATGLKWLLGDHLGSTAITADGSTGAKLSELRYKPWGELRYAWNTIPNQKY